MLVVGMSNSHYTTACSGRGIQQAVSLRQQLLVFLNTHASSGHVKRHCNVVYGGHVHQAHRAAHVASFLASPRTLDRFYSRTSERSFPSLVFTFFFSCVTRFLGVDTEPSMAGVVVSAV